MSKKYYGELKNKNDNVTLKMFENNYGEIIIKKFKNGLYIENNNVKKNGLIYEEILDYIRNGYTVKHLTDKAIYDLTQYIGVVDKDKDYMLLYAIPNEMTSYLKKNRNKYLEFENKLWR